MSRIFIAAVFLLAMGAGPATKPDEPKPFTKVEDVLARLPKDARPERGEWNEFNTPKANAALKDIMAAQKIEAGFPLEGNATLQAVKDGGDAGKVIRWNVTITIGDSPIRFDGAPGTLKVVTAGGEPFYIFADEKTARTAKTWKVGERVVLYIAAATLKVETRDTFTNDGKPRRENVYTLSVSAYSVKQVGATKIPPATLTPEEKERLRQQ